MSESVDKKEINISEKPQKKVLVFSITYHPFIGGAEVAVREITDRLPNIKFDMITLRLDPKLPKFERVDNVNVYRIGFTTRSGMTYPPKFPINLNKTLYPVMALFKAIILHWRNRYDISWAIMANYAGFAALFFKIINPRVSYLLTLQEGDSIAHIKNRVRFIPHLFKWIFTFADDVQAISHYLADFAKHFGYKKQAYIVSNGVDIAQFTKKYPVYELDALKKKLNKSLPYESSADGEIPPRRGDIFLVTTSRLVEKNAVIDIVDALVYLPNHVKLLVLGDGPEMKNIHKSARSNNVLDRIHFLGLVPYEDVPKYLQISDIFVRPSLSEGFGNSFVEAMAVGLPVIATPVGGIPDFLFDPKRNPDKPSTGLFCKVKNPESIAKQVMNLIDNPKLRDTIVHNAKKMVHDKYDWNIVAQKMQHIFGAIIDK